MAESEILLKQFSLIDVGIEVWPIVFTDYEQRSLTSPYIDEIWVAQEHGFVSKEEAEKWSAYLKEAVADQRFLSIQTNIITTGRALRSTVHRLQSSRGATASSLVGEVGRVRIRVRAIAQGIAAV
ncbi:MAG: hypothetical protein M1546_20050 [Chloroflexi bacterium]|nr:hypothetical protein [Chloroflexota bacterium]